MSEWIAFPSVTEQTDGQIVIDSTGLASGFDLERLELNAGVLRLGAISIGGFESVTLSSYQGDPDSYTVGGSIDKDGTLSGVAAAVSDKANTSRMQPKSVSMLQENDARNGELHISWNINALNSRISIADQFNPSIRAKQFNRIIKQDAIAGVSRHNTIDYVNAKSGMGNFFSAASDALFISGVVDSLQAGRLVNESYIGLHFLLVSVSAALSILTLREQERPAADTIVDPVFLGARFTRLAAANSVLASRRLVRATS